MNWIVDEFASAQFEYVFIKKHFSFFFEILVIYAMLWKSLWSSIPLDLEI